MSKEFKFLYLLLCCLGYLWVWYHFTADITHNIPSIPACLIHEITGYACPSCGTTRSISGLLSGSLQTFASYNPLFAIAVIACMTIGPALILADYLLQKDSFEKTYRKVIQIIEIRYIRNLLFLLITINWIRLILNGI